MWRSVCNRASVKKLKSFADKSNFRDTHLFEKPRQLELHPYRHPSYGERGFRRINVLGDSGFTNLGVSFGLLHRSYKGYASSAAAEEIVSTEEEDSDEIREMVHHLNKEIKAVETKSNSSDHKKQPRLVNGIGQGKYIALRRRQIKIETEAWENAAKEYQELLVDMCEQKLAPNLPYVKSLFLGWFEPLKNAIASEQDLCREGRNRGAYAPQFDQLPADMMTIITMHKLMGLLMTGGGQGGARVVQAALHIGEAVEHEARIHRFMEKSKRKASLNESPDDDSEAVNNEQQLQKLRKKVTNLVKKKKLQQVRHIVKQQDQLKPWGQDAQVKVGSRLIQLLMETAYIQPPVDQCEDCPPDIRPAFVHTLKTVETPRGSRRYGVIECDPLVRKGLEKSAMHMVIPYMPMLLPPVNWTGYNRGAYLFLPSYIMRTHGAKQQRDVVKKTPKKQLEPVFGALNTLGATKWRVNRKVLGVIDRIWASGGRLADLVDRDDVPLPEEPDTDDEIEIKKWKWKVKTTKKENRERHSQRCDIELKLAVARKMKDEEAFYYPHNLDFRGRAYPMHPYLNHLGSDLCRGVLEFADGRPLGESGLRWLKIHLANVYGGGVDKLSHEGRMMFAEKHLDEIFDSSDRPLEGKRWWLGAEDPFQCLATCMNLSEALRSSSPETAISHIPIHQDGSCNGLQHYAALGRDRLGAAAVNLVEGEKPADVYSGIASRVIEIMKRDAEGDPTTDPNAKHARILVDQVDRKLVKQTVMTSVYGVTYIGARDQIKRRLKERCSIEDDAELFAAACYAAKTTLTALGEMFESARSIMSWLGDCAKVIAVKNNPVQWTTPLGLPVVQPYRKLGRHLIKTSLQVLTLQRETDKVMVKRQRRAFPPNFVHSLDGSHMMMTTVACKEAGLSFAARKNPNSTLLRSKWSPIPIPYRTILEPKGQDLDYINIVHSHLLHSDWAKLDKLLTKSNSLRVKHILLKLQSDYVISLKFFKWIELHNPSLLTLETNSIILHILTKNRKFVSAESILKKIIGSCSRDVNLHSKLFDAVLHSYQMCDSTPRVFDALFKMYAQMKQFRNATYTFCRMKEYGFLPTIESCNMYMSSLLSFNRVDIALPFYNQMRRSKITINVFTLNMVMNAYVQLGKLENAVQVFDEMQGLGMNPFVSSYNTLITAYINQGLLTTAIKLKLTMEKNGISPNAITYNTIIHGFCKEGKLHDAFKVFLQMKRVNVDPNTITYNTLITACSQSGKIEKGNQIFEEMIRTGVKPDILTYNALLLGLCNEGKTKKAAYLVKELDKKKLVPNSSTFFALIKAQCARKNPDRGFQLYKSMVKSNCRPNEDTVKMLILSFLQTDDYDGAFGVFKEMLKRPIGPDLVVLSGLCKGFSKAWKDRLVMDLLSEVDNVCFSYERYEKVKSIICNSNNEGK